MRRERAKPALLGVSFHQWPIFWAPGSTDQQLLRECRWPGESFTRCPPDASRCDGGPPACPGRGTGLRIDLHLHVRSSRLALALQAAGGLIYARSSHMAGSRATDQPKSRVERSQRMQASSAACAAVVIDLRRRSKRHGKLTREEKPQICQHAFRI